MFSRIESVISARGLGSNYLFLVKDYAINLGLVGVVCTRDDGSVKIIVEGGEEKLMQFTERIKQLNALHPVENFYTKWVEPKGKFRDFSVNCNH